MTWKVPGLLALALAAVATPSHANSSTSPTGILWSACPAELRSLAGPLGKRLECGVALAPQNWQNDDGQYVRPVGLVRIAAGARTKRQGTLFMNFGGPGVHPAKQLAYLANEWQGTSALDPVQGVKRRIMQQFDLVAVVPRGLDDHDAFRCPALDDGPPNEYLMGERTDATWNALVATAHAYADACSSVPGAALMNSEQHVRDMELVRGLLGEDKLNLYGASYGGWIGALYGSLFPHRVGRMVIDSSADASGTIERFHLLRPHWHERDLTRLATVPLAKRPEFWGLGSDSQAIRKRLQAMPKWLRALWAGQVVDPEGVVAAVQVADMYASLPAEDHTRAAMEERVAGHHFHDHMDGTIREKARELVERLPEEFDTPSFGYGWPFVTLATFCNDGPWKSTPSGIRAALGKNSEFDSFDDGQSSLLMLICARWPRSASAMPSMAALRTAPAFLMIHNRVDHATPLKGALMMASELPNARLVVVEDMVGHGVMTSPDNCAITAAGEFLLTGTLPTEVHSRCVSGAQGPVPVAAPFRDEL